MYIVQHCTKKAGRKSITQQPMSHDAYFMGIEYNIYLKFKHLATFSSQFMCPWFFYFEKKKCYFVSSLAESDNEFKI